MSALALYDPQSKESGAKPGPGTYSPDKNIAMKKASGWKIGSEPRRDLTGDKLNESRVSPGAYDPNHGVAKQSAAAYGFGSQQRPGVLKDLATTPGPHHYLPPIKMGNEGNKHSIMGKNHPVDPHTKAGYPGPGHYDNHLAKTQHHDGHKYSMGNEPRGYDPSMKEHNAKPGAGAYDGHSPLNKKGMPKYGFGTA